MATCDRPRLLPLGLECFRRQDYHPFELIVVDDGECFPADPDLVRAAGGRLIRVEPGTSVGIKLNLGLESACGELCFKVDDDDWYGPSYLRRLTEARAARASDFCRPAIVYLQPYTIFDVAGWELRRFAGPSGSTLLFAREDWVRRPFRPVLRTEDTWFLQDQRQQGVQEIKITAPDDFVYIRHHGAGGGRAHTWARFADGRAVDQGIAQLVPDPRRPEDVLPAAALAAYRPMHHELTARGMPGSSVAQRP